MDKTVTRSLLIPLALGGTLASLTLCFEKLSAISESPIIGDAQRFLVTLLFPGMLGSMVMGGNVHAWNLWLLRESMG